MIDRGLNKEYITAEMRNVWRFIVLAGITKVSELLPEHIQAALTRIVGEKRRGRKVIRAAHTIYNMTLSVKRFARWLAQSNGTNKHALEDLAPTQLPEAKDWRNSRTHSISTN